MNKHVGEHLPNPKVRRIKIIYAKPGAHRVETRDREIVTQVCRWQKTKNVDDQQVFYNRRQICKRGLHVSLNIIYVAKGYFSNRSINSASVKVLITGFPFNARLGIWQAKSWSISKFISSSDIRVPDLI